MNAIPLPAIEGALPERVAGLTLRKRRRGGRSGRLSGLGDQN
ncbi:MAG: hypothetical protein NTU78_03645 [Alphaproteobacteria bacterium]|nr:hypothetical protein [Alphaproteobacteria bacterium]